MRMFGVLLLVSLIAHVCAQAGSPTGNGLKTFCTQQISCSEGCYGTGDGTCYNCGAVWYKNTSGTAFCTACPINSGILCNACTASTQCWCDSGYTGPNGGPCTACVAGKYKAASGSGVCTSCSSGKYKPTPGGTSSAACIICPTDSTSVSASIACNCNRGYTGPGVYIACVACAAGKYKDTSGSANCTDCAAGKVNREVAVITSDFCYDCDINSLGQSPAGSGTAEGCICKAGAYYIADFGGYCQGCLAGYYKDTIGNQVCTKCPNATYGNAYDGATACIACPAYSVCKGNVYPVHKCNQLGSCTCDTGYYGDPTDGVACTPCPANTGSVCTVGSSCGVIGHCLSNNGYYGFRESAGTACPSNAGSNCFQPTMELTTMCLQQADCLCNAGYVGPTGGPCIDPTTPCNAGYTDPNGVTCFPENTSMTLATSAPPATTPVPVATTPTPAAYVVKMTVALSLTLVQFTISEQVKFKQSVAIVAKVSAVDVSIDRIRSPPARRRLLDTGILVDTSVSAASLTTATTISSLTLATLQTELPAATEISGVSVVPTRAIPDTTPRPGIAPTAPARTIAVGPPSTTPTSTAITASKADSYVTQKMLTLIFACVLTFGSYVTNI